MSVFTRFRQKRQRSRALRRTSLGLLVVAGSLAAALPQVNLRAPSLEAAVSGGGPTTTGHVLINTHVITPAGQQTKLGNEPMNAVLSPDGKHLLVANSGARDPETLQVVDTATGRAVQSLPYGAPDGVVFGLAYSPDGKRAFASGGGFNTIHSFNVGADGMLTPAGDIALGNATASIFPMGMSVTPDGTMLLVANNLANTVAAISLDTLTVVATIPVGGYPYTVAMAPDGKQAVVSNWGDGTLGVIDMGVIARGLASGAGSTTNAGPATIKAMTRTIVVGKHPTSMVFGRGGRLYVANANSDSVSDVVMATGQVARTISVSPYAHAPLSSSPVSLALSPNGKLLYAANAGENAVAVIDVAAGRTTGRIPTAWYPSTVVTSLDGRTLWVTNAKGYGAGPNNEPGLDPNPTRKHPRGNADPGYCNCAQSQYSGSMIDGTLSVITAPGSDVLAAYTAQVNSNNHVRAAALLARSMGNPIPAMRGAYTPFKHVIYLNKENRTYDQIFGDLGVGNSDPSLALFGRTVTPNLHALVDRFGVFDNFYADAEVSADGHNWINGAYASDYNEKMWPQDYSQGAGRNRGYDFEGDSLINLNPGGYLWDSAAEAGITYRDYGNFYAFHSAKYLLTHSRIIPAGQASSCAGPVAHSYTSNKVVIPTGMVLCLPAETVNPVTTPHLVGHIDPRFRTFDGNYREADRVAEWQREFAAYVASGTLPALEFLRFPNDHTSGTRLGQLTPQAFVAENDAAVGAVVDAVSHSRYWKDTLIVVTEDDAQNGPDHVDAHRTEALAISAYNSYRGVMVDHTMYDTAAMVRTIELVLGLRPLSQYDAQAVPMWRLFMSTPDLRPYSARAETISPMRMNGATAYGVQLAAQLDFSREDLAPSGLLNQLIWHAVKGANTPYPTIHHLVVSAGAKDK